MFYRVDARNAEIEATVTKYPKSTASSSQSASSSSHSASSSSQSASSSSQSASTPSKGSQSRGKHPSGTDSTPKGTKMIASHLQKLTPKQVVIKKTQPTDFFGRVIKVIKLVLNHVGINSFLVYIVHYIFLTQIWFGECNSRLLNDKNSCCVCRKFLTFDAY